VSPGSCIGSTCLSIIASYFLSAANLLVPLRLAAMRKSKAMFECPPHLPNFDEVGDFWATYRPRQSALGSEHVIVRSVFTDCTNVGSDGHHCCAVCSRVAAESSNQYRELSTA